MGKLRYSNLQIPFGILLFQHYTITCQQSYKCYIMILSHLMIT